MIYLIHIHLPFSVQDGKIQLNKKYIAAQTDANIEPVYITKLYSFYFTNYRLLGTREEFYLPTHNVMIATNKVHNNTDYTPHCTYFKTPLLVYTADCSMCTSIRL